MFKIDGTHGVRQPDVDRTIVVVAQILQIRHGVLVNDEALVRSLHFCPAIDSRMNSQCNGHTVQYCCKTDVTDERTLVPYSFSEL
jgi:hypothetical protein